jgi:NAD(P)-dependent dehydrogenase (short-subunit alcohol dehydrogenase family)
VVVSGRKASTVDTAVAEIRKQLPRANVDGVVADLSDAAGCAALVRAVPSVDVLVNNVGIFEPKDFFRIPDEDWTRFF